jgi:hypothetical protein
MSSHQRESFCVKLLAGASSVVLPCIAVMGVVPAARDRVEETTDWAVRPEPVQPVTTSPACQQLGPDQAAVGNPQAAPALHERDLRPAGSG